MLEVSDAYVLKENGMKIAMFTVGPPNIQIQVPSMHHMLQNLEVHIMAALCVSQEFKVQLLYRALEVFSRDNSKVVAKTTINLHTTAVHIVFLCQHFANAGFYTVQLVSSLGQIIQAEQWILVNETTSVSLQLRNDSIFPHCVRDFPVQWKTAECDTAQLNYRLRVSAIPEGSINHEHRSHYIGNPLSPTFFESFGKCTLDQFLERMVGGEVGQHGQSARKRVGHHFRSGIGFVKIRSRSEARTAKDMLLKQELAKEQSV
ncbi:hypothetical protein KIN20_033151 [Parelaphostrongylus tenuis]|uniref:Uncharacterized protein n=1 Tax=Parelaphostrongylus tenuis TaxID=148309 RepID=A0AAD5WI08_PARTN|nr:hypothetical protein KIN20_033151 [Parelaphostrongylus tenuis]